MTKGLVVCGTCGMEMVRQYEGGKKKLRASILVWDGEQCIGKCRKCGADVPLQLSLDIPSSTARRKKSIHFVISR